MFHKKEKVHDDEPLEVDESNENIDFARLSEAYQLLGITDLPAQEAEVKEAYYLKRQEIREYGLKNEATLLLKLVNAYDYILSHIDVCLEDVGNSDKKQEYDADAGCMEDNIPKQKFHLFRPFKKKDIEWEDMMRELDKVDMTQKSRKKLLPGKKTIALAVIGSVLAVAIILCIPDIIRLYKNGMPQISDEQICSDLLERGLYLENGVHITLSEDAIAMGESTSAFYLPGIRIYIRKIAYELKTENSILQVQETAFYRYCFHDNDKIQYEFIKALPSVIPVSLKLDGTWAGSCRISEQTDTVTKVRLTLNNIDEYTLSGICEVTTDNGKKGSYKIIAKVNTEKLTVSIKGTEWIEKPAFFIMSDFNACYDLAEDMLLPVLEKDIFCLKREKE